MHAPLHDLPLSFSYYLGEPPYPQNIVPERAPGSRRTSSLGSEKSFRYLKLGPVHWGEHTDEHKEDFHHVE
ncbi:hypothetical protein PG997_009880 [Apiospora hydei]|uniref:Uncharacterized protein n=1 Tax=Apiospora hydei TaxID=1337664 RepID=A0ABR1VWJ1_9PEZI